MTSEAMDAALTELAKTFKDLQAGVKALERVKPPRGLDAGRLVSELKKEWERVNRRRLVHSTEEEEEEEEEKKESKTALSPTEVLARWQSDGPAWVQTCSRPELRAVVSAANDPTTGPVLLTEAAFWMTLKARLRERRADQVLNNGFFITEYLPWIEVAIRSRAADTPNEVPRWWVDPGPNTKQLAFTIAKAAATATYVEVLEQLGLPDVLNESFFAKVAAATRATQASELASLGIFLDFGKKMGNKSVIFESTREWVRRATQVGVQFPRERLAIAELLRRRIGEIGAGRDDARWVGMNNEQKTVRTWLIGEIFRVLFSHLTPDIHQSHQTEPRRKFWSRYDRSVEKIWLLICDDHRDRLDGDPAVEKLRQHGLLEVLRFKGQTQQDGLWMQLRSDVGEYVSILEGNASMPILIRKGRLSPPVGAQAMFRPSMRVVEYNQAKSLFLESDGTIRITHQGLWESRAATTLSMLSIYP